MKKKEIDPKVAAIVVVAIVGLAIGGFVLATSNQGPPVDLKTVTKEQIEDPDPPKPGQPGYRERITDPPGK